MLSFNVKINEWDIRRYSAIRILGSVGGTCQYACVLYVYESGCEAVYKTEVVHEYNDGVGVLMEKIIQAFEPQVKNSLKKKGQLSLFNF